MITYALGSVKSAASKAGADACFLVLRPNSGQKVDLDAEVMAQAVEAANEAGGPDWLLKPAGPVADGWAIVVARHEMRAADPTSWLTKLVGVLDSQGVSGRLVAVGRRLPQPDYDHGGWIEEAQGRLYPALYLSHPPTRALTDPNAPTGWLATPEATQARAGDAVRQCFAPTSPDEEIRGGIHTIDSDLAPLPDSAPSILAATAAVSRAAGVLTWSNNLAYRRAKMFSAGEFILSLSDARCKTLEIVDRLRGSLTVAPHLASYGFIRTSRWGTTAFHDFYRPQTGHLRPQEEGITGPENPWADGGRWQQNHHLHDEYAIDAHALNLLTGKHLERANDLSKWSITEVDSDRYLVETRDLHPWFDGPPDPAVLEQARQDFGDMLLTWDVVRERPGPMTVYPPHLPQPKR